MSGNSFGKLLRLTTFGESHGKAIGGILDGFPAGVKIDKQLLNLELNRRKTNQNEWSSSRDEKDEIEVLSGVFDDFSLGTPIAFLVWNKDQLPSDYKHLAHAYRPSHADFTFEKKYGIRDHRGGGRSSARETIARVIGGTFAKMLLNTLGVHINAFVNRIGTVAVDANYKLLNMTHIESSSVRCPDNEVSKKMLDLIETHRKRGDTLGGEISCIIEHAPVGWGEPVFDKLHANLGKAMLSINAVKGFSIGSGFEAAKMSGTAHNDLFKMKDGEVKTKTNFSGGVQGGISNGEDIYFRVAFKPVATLMKEQLSIDNQGNAVSVEGKGRHDVCVVPRAVPIVEAMTALVLADHFLLNRTARL